MPAPASSGTDPGRRAGRTRVRRRHAGQARTNVRAGLRGFLVHAESFAGRPDYNVPRTSDQRPFCGGLAEVGARRWKMGDRGFNSWFLQALVLFVKVIFAAPVRRPLACWKHAQAQRRITMPQKGNPDGSACWRTSVVPARGIPSSSALSAPTPVLARSRCRETSLTNTSACFLLPRLSCDDHRSPAKTRSQSFRNAQEEEQSVSSRTTRCCSPQLRCVTMPSATARSGPSKSRK